MTFELDYSQHVALNQLLQSYRTDRDRSQTFTDFSVMPNVEVTTDQLLKAINTPVSRTRRGRRKKPTAGS